MTLVQASLSTYAVTGPHDPADCHVCRCDLRYNEPTSVRPGDETTPTPTQVRLAGITFLPPLLDEWGRRHEDNDARPIRGPFTLLEVRGAGYDRS